MKLKFCRYCELVLPLDAFHNAPFRDGKSYKCKKCISKYHKIRSVVKRDILREKARNYYLNNRERMIKNATRYKIERSKIDKPYRITCYMRSRLCELVKGKKGKTLPTSKIVGCSFYELRIHLENLFKDGMTWDNYGITGWHVDHIIPCASFDFNKPEEVSKCFHYTNLQPLWATDNIIKGDKIIHS